MKRALAARVLRSFSNYNYRLWSAGALVSNTGTWMQRTAQDWLVLTQLTDNDASTVGVVMALQFGPQLLLLPFTGFAADHYNRHRLLMITQSAMAVTAAILGLLTVTGLVALWHVYLLAFLFGCASAFDAPARQSFVADLVGDGDLSNAVALNATWFNAGRMIGPAVAGLVIAGVGTGWAFLINAGSFVAVLAALIAMRPGELRPQARAARARGNFVAGLAYVRHRPDLIAILVMLFLIGTFGLNFPIFISTMAVRVFETDARGYGVLASFVAIGTFTGAIIAAGRDTPRFSRAVRGAAGFGLGCALAALAPSYWTFAAALVFIGMAALQMMTTTSALMQLTTDPAMRGRVLALRMAIVMGGTPVGAPIVGWIADSFGPRWALGAGAASGFVAAGLALIYLLRSARPGAARW